jgi:hypothetical protein
VGGDADGDPSARSASSCIRYSATDDCRKRGAAAEVARIEAHEDDPGVVGGGRRSPRLREPEVVELADRRVAAGAQLAVDVGVHGPDVGDGEALGAGDHRLAPRPEVAAGSATPQQALEGMAMRVHEARNGKRRHGLSSQAVTTRTVNASLAQLPNALTLMGLALIPVFIGLLLRLLDRGYSWPAAIVFGIAG